MRFRTYILLSLLLTLLFPTPSSNSVDAQSSILHNVWWIAPDGLVRFLIPDTWTSHQNDYYMDIGPSEDLFSFYPIGPRSSQDFQSLPSESAYIAVFPHIDSYSHLEDYGFFALLDFPWGEVAESAAFGNRAALVGYASDEFVDTILIDLEEMPVMIAAVTKTDHLMAVKPALSTLVNSLHLASQVDSVPNNLVPITVSTTPQIQLLRSISGTFDCLNNYQLSPDGTHIAGYGVAWKFEDDRSCQALWEIRAGREIFHGDYPTRWVCNDVAIQHDNQIMACQHKGDLKTISIGPLILFRSSFPILDFIFTPDDTQLMVVTQSGIQLINRDTGVAVDVPTQDLPPVQKAQFSSDGTRLALYTSALELIIWDMSAGHIIARQTLGSDALSTMAFSLDKTYLAYTAAAYTTLWNINTSENLFTLPIAAPCDNSSDLKLALNPDNTLLALSCHHASFLVDTLNGQVLVVIMGNSHAEFDPTGTYLFISYDVAYEWGVIFRE